MATEAVIGKILVNVEARIDKLEKGFRRGMKEINTFGDRAGKAFSIFNSMVGVTSVLSVGALTAAIAKSTAEIDKLAKTAQTIGIATEALASLRHAANLTGVDTQTLDNSLRKMTIRISEAATGSGEAVKVLEELGLSAHILKTMAPEKQFAEIASKLGEVRNHSDKVRIATKLFEEEGAKLVNTLNLGKRGLAEAAREAEKLGLAISAEDAAKVEHLADAWDRFTKATGATSNKLTIAIAPAAADALDGFAMAIADINAISLGGKAGQQMKNQPDWLQRSSNFFGTNSNPLHVVNMIVDDFFMELSKQRGQVRMDELSGLSPEARARRSQLTFATRTEATDRRAAQIMAETQAEENRDMMARLRAGRPTDQRRENLLGLLGDNMNPDIKPVYEWQKSGKPLMDALKGFSGMLEQGARGLQQGRDSGMFGFAQGLEKFRQAQYNVQQRMDIAEEVRSRGSQPRAQSGIIEQGTSEAFATLRKNLYKTDDRQRELVAINKAMLKAGIEQKDYAKELVNWFKSAVAVGT